MAQHLTRDVKHEQVLDFYDILNLSMLDGLCHTLVLGIDCITSVRPAQASVTAVRAVDGLTPYCNARYL